MGRSVLRSRTETVPARRSSTSRGCTETLCRPVQCPMPPHHAQGSARVSRQDCPSGRQGHQWPFLPAKPQECGSSLSWKVPPSPPELPLFGGRKRMARKGLGGEAPSQHGPEDSS